jgi:hypothetical protein
VAILEEARRTIRQAPPNVPDVISGQIPTFKQHRILVYFAAWKEQIGLKRALLLSRDYGLSLEYESDRPVAIGKGFAGQLHRKWIRASFTG